MSRIPPLWFAACFAALAAAPPAARAAAAPVDEQSLLARIHEVNEAQMELGRLAQARGHSALTRRFGARLERDHDEVDARLLRRAEQRGLSVPEDDAGPDEQRAQARLKALQGPEFDRALAAAVDADQAQAQALLRSERALTSDRRTRRDLDAALPLLDEHRRLAAYLQRRTEGQL